ncbi:PREDICTED: transcription factor GTE12-like isoform X2 [Lupinus angustifolius]|uniref:transcription factor GTE12-like isoform X2 n=1 Tax=Lupinus angustifolius TaxID=3871 RepID=UPI00092E8DFC|nr:PREDICTED: transcription factor GTE12-like isoform X2 [Lupinus angustifolius]
MIATATVVPKKKFKIKLSSKRIEVVPGTKCEFRQNVSQVDENGFCNSKEKFSVPCSIKRGPQGSVESQKPKRQKMDRTASVQCATVLKILMSQTYSWVFNKPVDPIALKIPDYFRIISQPMDLGTIKTKLEKNVYFGIEEFAADVRLTFSNAMTYNPHSNDVHLMAKDLNKLFERKWKDLEKKWKCEDEHEKSMTETVRETVRKFCNEMHPLQKDTFPKKLRVPEQKGLQKISSLAARDAKVEVHKSSWVPCQAIEKDLHKGKDNHDRKYPSVSSKARPSSDISSEGSVGRDLNVKGADALRPGCQTHCKTPLQRKSYDDSNGDVSSLDSEHLCYGSQLSTPATDASSCKVWSTPDIDVQLSPKKALRAAMLKSRFADTILKAQQKTILDHGDKSDPLKMRLEKERLERIQREERARIEAQIKVAELSARMKAEEEFKKRREEEREAARVALQKVESSVEIENNLECLKELEMLSGCKLCYQPMSTKDGSGVAMRTLDKSPLEQLGLFMKDEYVTAGEDEEVLDGCEEGEILY